MHLHLAKVYSMPSQRQAEKSKISLEPTEAQKIARECVNRVRQGRTSNYDEYLALAKTLSQLHTENKRLREELSARPTSKVTTT